MKWKNELPKKPGWYWLRKQDNIFKGTHVSVVEVRNHNGALAVGNSYLHGWKSMEEAEWAGPIPAPETPPHPLLVDMLESIRDTADVRTNNVTQLREKLTVCGSMAKTTLGLIRNGELS